MKQCEIEDRFNSKCKFFAMCDHYYSSDEAKRNIVLNGGYCIYVKDSIITRITHEQGGNRQGGTVFELSPFSTFTRQWDSTISEIRRTVPQLYEFITPYLAPTTLLIQNQE